MYKSEKSAYGEKAVFSSGCGAASRFLLVAFLAFMLLSVSQVYAAAGDIKVTVTREVGGVTSGFTVEVLCPSGAYTQLTGTPTTDGSGVVQAAPDAASNCDNAEAIDIRVSKDGYVTNIVANGTSGYTYLAASDPNDYAATGIQYAYKITSIPAEGSGTELKATVSGVNVGDAQGTACVQGGDTNWYCAVPLTDTTLAIQVAKDGYVKDATSLAFNTDRTLATAAQETATTGSVKHNYRFKVVKMDGATAYTGLVSGDFTFGATSADFYEVGAGVYDVAFTDAGGAVVTRKFNKDGYTTAANNMGNSAVVANQPAARIDDSGSPYTPIGNYKMKVVKMDGATGLAGLATGAFAFSVAHIDFKDSTGGVYEFAIPAAGATPGRSLGVDGYVNKSYTAASAIASQPAAQVDDSGTPLVLQGNYKMKVVMMDGATGIAGLGTGAFAFEVAHTDFIDSTGGVYEFAIPAAGATPGRSLGVDGYVNTTYGATSALANQPTAQVDDSGTPIALQGNYRIKVVKLDGATGLTGLIGVNFAFSVAHTDFKEVGAGVYEFSILGASATQGRSLGINGYVNTTYGATSAIANQPTAQVDDSGTAIVPTANYRLKVAKMDGATGLAGLSTGAFAFSITHSDFKANGSGVYDFAIVGAGATLGRSLDADGYVNTTYGATSAIANQPTAQVDDSGTAITLQGNYRMKVTDELTAPITGLLTGAFTFGRAHTDSKENGTGIYDFAIPAGAAPTRSVAKAGYVTNATTSTSGAIGTTLTDDSGTPLLLYYTVKVIVNSIDTSPVTGATAAIVGGLLAVDGGANDADSAANGVIFIAQDPSGLGGGPHTIDVSKATYLNWSDSTITINASAQTVYTTALLSPTVVSIGPSFGNVNSSYVNSSAIVTITGYAGTSVLNVTFNSVNATILAGGTTAADGTASINISIPAGILIGTYDINVTDALGNNNTLAAGFLVMDTIPPIINLTYVNESDIFVSDNALNNIITIMVNVTDPGYTGNASIPYMIADFSAITGLGLVYMDYDAGTGLWNATLAVTDVTDLEFQPYNVTISGVDQNSTAAVGTNFTTVVLYNMTTPPTGSACMQWGSGTTDFSELTNFAAVNFVLNVQINMSCMLGTTPPGAPAWFSDYTSMALINFTSIDLSTQEAAAKLAGLGTAMQVNITPPGQFGDSRIYFDTAYFAELNTTTNITLYHLPFSSIPAVAADADAAGVNGSLVWVQGVGEGNLTFVVDGFSGYNVTDSVVPGFTVLPANGSSTNNVAALFDIYINGTGTQLSSVIIVVSNSSNSSTFLYDDATNTANCTNVTQGSELFQCTFNMPSNLSNGVYTINVTAIDYGGAAGNSNNSITTFTFNGNAPTVTLTTPDDSNVTISDIVNFYWTPTSSVAGDIKCNLTINGTVNQSNIASVNATPVNMTVLGFVNGTYTWSVTCNDSAGNIGTSATRTFIVDNVAPVVSVLTPANLTVTNSTNISLTFNVTDNVASTATCVAYYSNSTAIATAVTATASGASQTAGYYTGSDAYITWYVNCTDGVGNTGMSMLYNITKDTVAPVINTATVSDSYVSTGQYVTVTVNVSDAFTNVSLTGVTANGVQLNYSAGLFSGLIPLTGSAGARNVTIVALDNASNANVSYVYYTMDNTAPVITLNSPANGATVTSAAGELLVNFTVTEANISVCNISIDSGTIIWTNSTNGTVLVYLPSNVSAGNHTLLIYALDNASLSSTSSTSFVVSAPVDVTQTISIMQTSAGTNTLTAVSLLDAANSSDYSADPALNATNFTLKLNMTVNATSNTTVTIPSFSGSNVNWNATNFGITTNTTGTVANNVATRAGGVVVSIVSFINMSSFIPNTAYTNGTVITFNESVSGLDVLYISDDTGDVIYKLSQCAGNTAPATITSATQCYTNTSTTVTAYVPHLSGVALSSDFSAPTVNITSPTSGSTVANSYATFSFDAWEANPNATTFCSYNLTNGASVAISSANLTTASFTQVGTKYSYSTTFSALNSTTYNLSVGCVDVNGNATLVNYVFNVTDTTAPAVTAISSSVSGTSVTITVTTSEIAECRYYASDVAYANMTVFGTTNVTSHSTTISSLIAGTTYTYYVRCNDTAGNNMSSSNSTTFTIGTTGGSSCSESWTCTAWTNCLSGNTQVRTCTDANACGTVVNKPAEAQYCIYVAPATCLGTCGLGFYQRPYPDCSCAALACTNTCSAGQTRNEYPDCTCVTTVTNVTGPGDITVTPKRDGVVIDIPGMAAGRSTSLGSYLTSAIMDSTGILDVALTPNKDLTGVKVDIVKLAAKPATVAAPQGITVYSYLEIKVTNLTSNDLVNATVTFKVPKSYIGTKYNASSVVLMRLVGSEWTILETKIASQTTLDYVFEAKTPGFSYFAIAIAEMGEPPIVIIPPVNGTNDTGPGVEPIGIDSIVIWVVGIIVAVGIIAFAYQKVTKQKKWKPRSPR